jgi:hypothetical protein
MKDFHVQMQDLVTSGLFTDFDGEELVGHPRMVGMEEVAAQPMRWLWPGRIACGKVTVLAGEPGLGTSVIALDIAARASSGAGWPHASGGRGERWERGQVMRVERGGGPAPQRLPAVGVVLVCGGDAIADTIRPRLDAAGADVRRVQALRTVCQTDGVSQRQRDLPFVLERDLATLDEAIDKTPGCRLVVIDPVVTPGEEGPRRERAAVRKLIDGLTGLAERKGVAVLAVAHLERLTVGPGLHSGARGMALVEAAQAGWAVLRAIADPTGVWRVFVPIKNNLGDDRAGLFFRLRGDARTGAAKVVWEDQRRVMRWSNALIRRYGRSAKYEAADWLTDVLGWGPQPAREVKEKARRDGIMLRTLDRAKVILGVRTQRAGFGGDGLWVWDLPWQESGPGVRDGGRPAGGADGSVQAAVETLDGSGATGSITASAGSGGEEVAANGAGDALWNNPAENAGNDPGGSA